MTSQRKRKKDAASVGLSERELALAEMMEEMLEQMRWLWVLGYSNQYLVSQKLKIEKPERDKILEAATRAVERDGKLQDWQDRLAAIKGEILHVKREVNRSKKHMAQERRRGAAGGDDDG